MLKNMNQYAAVTASYSKGFESSGSKDWSSWTVKKFGTEI